MAINKQHEHRNDTMDGVQVETQRERAEGRTTTAPVSRIRVEHVAKAYVARGLWPLVRRNPVLTDASLEIAAGEITAIVGANCGAPKIHPQRQAASRRGSGESLAA